MNLLQLIIYHVHNHVGLITSEVEAYGPYYLSSVLNRGSPPQACAGINHKMI